MRWLVVGMDAGAAKPSSLCAATPEMEAVLGEFALYCDVDAIACASPDMLLAIGVHTEPTTDLMLHYLRLWAQQPEAVWT